MQTSVMAIVKFGAVEDFDMDLLMIVFTISFSRWQLLTHARAKS